MAKPQQFSPNSFTPTKYSTAEQKAAVANHLLGFIAAGFPENKFTKAFYERLCNCFGFIAHLNRNGFFETFFTCTADKLRFIEAVVNARCYGDPEYTYSDVERAVGELVRSQGWVSVYRTKLAQENETIERTLLASLQAKYEGSATAVRPSTPLDSASARRPVVSVPVVASQRADVQFSLFR
jgi:hypothetical protein